MKSALIAVVIGAASLPAGAGAQQVSISQTIAGSRLDVLASGEVSRVPDMALISAGVMTQAPSASAALQDSASRMQGVVAVLKRAGIADADIQTSNVSLSPQYRYPDNQSPQLVGYRANNSVMVRFRNMQRSGAIIDALVGAGANEVNGPSLVVDHPESALDEARRKAVAAGRARADLYALSLGMHVVRVVSVSETETNAVPPPMPMMMQARAAPATKIEPGEQKLSVNLAMTFELQ